MEFSKLNGYDVKDTTSRTKVNEHDITLSEHQNKLNEHDNKFNFVSNNKTLFIGDSYALGSNPSSDTLTPWPVIVKNLMGLSNDNYKLVAENGIGFLEQGTSNHTFLELLQSEISNITDKNNFKNIILCGGYNDNTYNLTDIREAIGTFVNYCHTQFPNATIYIGCIGYRNEISSSGATTRDNIARKVYPAYANNISVDLKDYVYLNGVENILKTLPKSYMYSDNSHPNQNGQNALGQGIYQAFKTGYVENYSSGSITLTNSDASSITGNITVRHCNNICSLTIPQIKLTFAEETNFSLSAGSLTTICQYAVNNFIGGTSNDINVAECTVSIQDYNKGRHVLPGYIMFDTTGNVKLFVWETIVSASTGTSNTFPNVKEIEVFRTKCIIPELFS